MIDSPRNVRDLGWLTRKEAAELASVSTRTISRWRAAKRVTWAWGFVGGQPVPLFEPSSVEAAIRPPVSAA